MARRQSLAPISASQVTHPGTPVHLLFDEDAPLVAGGFEAANGNVMLDIGNAGPTIIEYHWAEQHGLASKLAHGTRAGSRRLSRGTINLGPFTLKNVEVAYFGPGERGSELTHSVAAIAGEPLLSRLTRSMIMLVRRCGSIPWPSIANEPPLATALHFA